MNPHRRRFWIESALAASTAFLLLLTLAWRDWIEAVLRVNPDARSGTTEWLVVALLGTVAVVSTIAARAEWRRTAPSN